MLRQNSGGSSPENLGGLPPPETPWNCTSMELTL